MSKVPTAVLGITQKELETFQQLQVDKAKVCQDYDELRARLLDQLVKGAPIQDGILTAEFSVSSTIRPDWKKAFLDNLGQAAADRVLLETPAVELRLIKVHRRSRLP